MNTYHISVHIRYSQIMGLPIVRLVLSFFFYISVTINVYMLVLIRNYRLVLIRKHYVFFVIYDILCKRTQ